MASKRLPYQQRVIDECDALTTKAGALWLFMGTPTYRALDTAERTRLRLQWKVMQLYAEILRDRIGVFDGE